MFGLESVIITGIFKLALALVGIIMCRATLMWFDHWSSHNSFSTWLDGAEDDAKAVYYAGRFIAVAIIVGFAIS